MGKHAILSASGSSRWVRCPGSPAFTLGMANSGSNAAKEGSAAHFLAAYCLRHVQYPKIAKVPIDPLTFDGRRIMCGMSLDDEDVVDFQDTFDVNSVKPDSVSSHIVTKEMAYSVLEYTRYVEDLLTEYPSLVVLVEQVLDLSFLTGEPEAVGTADLILVNPYIDGSGPDFTLAIHDFKYGYTPVDVENNDQLMLYAASAIDQYGMVYDIGAEAVVRLGIHQPRCTDGEPKIWDFRAKDLMPGFIEKIKCAANMAWGLVQSRSEPTLESMAQLIPGDVQCQWCIGKASCPTLEALVYNAAGVDTHEINTGDYPSESIANVELAVKFGACDLVESWAKAVRAKVYEELNGGHRVPGYKLVIGRKGPRKWSDPIEAEQFLRTSRLKVDEMYEKTLATPTALEKIIGPKGTSPQPVKWDKVQRLITQADGKPSISRESDLRSAIKVEHLQFNNIGDS